MYSGSKLWKTKEQAWKRSKPNSELNSNKTDQKYSSLTRKRLEANRLANRKQRHNTGFGKQADRQDNRERRFRLSSLYVDGVLVHVVRGQTPSEGSEGYMCRSDRCWPSVFWWWRTRCRWANQDWKGRGRCRFTLWRDSFHALTTRYRYA